MVIGVWQGPAFAWYHVQLAVRCHVILETDEMETLD